MDGITQDPLSAAELAWTAGMIDGDGCITMTHNGKWRRPVVVVDNTDRSIIDELVCLHGGSVVAKKVRESGQRQCWSWRLYGTLKIRAFLQSILPYMRCDMKRIRATMIVDELPTLTTKNGHYTTEMVAAKIAFENRFMALGTGRGSRNWRPIRPSGSDAKLASNPA